MVRKKTVPERNGGGHSRHGRRCLGFEDDQSSSPVGIRHGGAVKKKRGRLHNQHITQSVRALRQLTLELLPSPSMVRATVDLIGENLEVLDTPVPVTQALGPEPPLSNPLLDITHLMSLLQQATV